jgi:hypothetical protein
VLKQLTNLHVNKILKWLKNGCSMESSQPRQRWGIRGHNRWLHHGELVVRCPTKLFASSFAEEERSRSTLGDFIDAESSWRGMGQVATMQWLTRSHPASMARSRSDWIKLQGTDCNLCVGKTKLSTWQWVCLVGQKGSPLSSMNFFSDFQRQGLMINHPHDADPCQQTTTFSAHQWNARGRMN